jgi:hypothetical protein
LKKNNVEKYQILSKFIFMYKECPISLSQEKSILIKEVVEISKDFGIERMALNLKLAK